MKATIAIATGDPAGIGPEVSLKAALDIAGRNRASPAAMIEAVRRLTGRQKAEGGSRKLLLEASVSGHPSSFCLHPFIPATLCRVITSCLCRKTL
jgi:hypothetical protein